MDEQVRTFVAVELPEEVKVQLGEIETRLNRQIVMSLGAMTAGKALKWVEPTAVHVTLKFLGSVAAERLNEIESALKRAAAGKAPFTIELTGLGAFPNTNRPRVIWVGAHGQVVELGNLQADVDAQLVDLGFPQETRPFSPHLTLARLREGTNQQELRKIGEIVNNNAQTESITVKIDTISLMRSDLSRVGARYTRMAEIALSDLSST